MKYLKMRFWYCEEALETKGLKVNVRKTKEIINGLDEELFKSKIDSYGVCERRLMAKLVLRTK